MRLLVYCPDLVAVAVIYLILPIPRDIGDEAKPGV